MTFNGLHLLAVIVIVLAVYLAAHLVEWHRRNEYRKLERLVHRNMHRISGGQS